MGARVQSSHEGARRAGARAGQSEWKRHESNPRPGVLSAAVALSGCGSSTKVVTDASTSERHPRRAPRPASASSASSTSTTTSASASASASAVRAASAACWPPPSWASRGPPATASSAFALRNTSARSCHTFGYPGILFLSRSGAPLPTASTRTTHDFFGSAPEAAIVLAPGSTASFRVGVTHGISSSAGCATAGALQVIAPDDTATLRVPIPGGAYECGTATVSPLQPGNVGVPLKHLGDRVRADRGREPVALGDVAAEPAQLMRLLSASRPLRRSRRVKAPSTSR